MYASLVAGLLLLGPPDLSSTLVAAGARDRVAESRAVDSLALEEQMLREIVARSFPGLEGADIHLKPFRSASDYFRTSFNVVRCVFGVKMRFFVLVNPEWRKQGAPLEGVRAILAHELAHVEDLRRGKRIRLFRLVGLVSKTDMARMERRADLAAIARDYGSGLKAYRIWLYDHVPADTLPAKRRNYFSPDEIDAIVAALARRPDLLGLWTRYVPMNLKEIQAAR